MKVIARLLAGALFCASLPVHAQGTLSSQGFGYPPGGMSARALATGGGLAEIEPLTNSNPAVLSLWSRPGLYLQFEPELRRVHSETESERGVVARFPMITAAMAIGPRATLAISATTLLDRTWSVRRIYNTVVGGDELEATSVHRATGAMNDVRIGGAWAHSRALQLGAGLHYVTGLNRVTVENQFDRSDFGPFSQRTDVSYGGPAASVGVIVRRGSDFIAGVSARKGGTLRAQRQGEILASAGVPDRVGISLGYLGFTGATLSAHYGWDGWSAMQGLGSDIVVARDTYDAGLGGEIGGPSVRGTVVTLRAGARWRTLPFDAGGSQVGERAFTFGAGVPLARNSSFDMAVQRARRTNDGPVSETGWTLSFGLAVRP